MNVNISVVIPAYNAAETLLRTLDALLKQTRPNWEAIVVDDGSEDETAAIAHQAAHQDSRIRIVSRPNGGASAARNTGAQLAQYEWLLFLDADDEIAASYMAKMSAEIEKAPALDAVYCGWVRVASDGSWGAQKRLPDPADLPTTIAYYCPFAIHACVVKRTAFMRANGFDTELKTCEDWDLWQRIAR
ncbi:MAG: glycosyltransferase [Phormidesmis sp.]